MKHLLLALLLSGCTLQLEDKRLDPAKVEQILFNHDVNIRAINGYIKELQDAKILPRPKEAPEEEGK